MMAIGFIEKSRGVHWLQCSGALLACLAAPAGATDVALAGVFPGKALLVVNGGAPRAAAVGTRTAEGVRILAVEGDSATLEFDGQRQRLVVGQQAVNVSAAGSQGRTLNIPADGGGQFHASGAVNGAAVRFVVDTGASYVSLGRGDALKAGIDATRGEPVLMQTANGVVQARRVRLDSVQLGDLTLHNIEGIVQGVDLPFVLLGMSFLNRMEMRRDGMNLQLRQRY